jgi:hypothetical protein
MSGCVEAVMARFQSNWISNMNDVNLWITIATFSLVLSLYIAIPRP